MTTTRRRQGTVSFPRYKLGLSQQQLADCLGISRSLVAMVETGKRTFPQAVADLYLALCRKAEQKNPNGVILIKRGRKPRTFAIVTNSEQIDQKVIAERLEKKKEALMYQHTALQFRRRSMDERRSRLLVQLTEVDAMLNVYTKLLSKLPEGKHRDRYEYRAALLYAKQIKLKQQLKKYSAVVLLQTEHQVKMLAAQIVLIDEWMVKLDKPAQASGGNIDEYQFNLKSQGALEDISGRIAA